MILKTDRLEIDVLEPGTVYKRSRFDWSGIVKQITLDKSHTFCSCEASAVGPGTEGIGLTYEFGKDKPVGYDEISAGEWFPKIGIGALKKESMEPYDFFHDYEIKPSPFNVTLKENHLLEFTQESENINGYQWTLTRTIELMENTLLLSSQLTNTGTKPIITEEYCHNFLQLDKKEVGTDYKVTLTGQEQFLQNDFLTVTQESISPSPQMDKYFYGNAESYELPKPLTWTLTSTQTPAKITAEEQFPADHFAIWGMKHVISPEVFIQFSLAPGASEKWSRKYTFTS